MALIVETLNFKGSLLDLLGMDRDALTKLSRPTYRMLKGNAERLAWREEVRNEEDGMVFPILFLARLYAGKVWEVGIHSAKYFFIVEFNEQGSSYFGAVPKGPQHDPLAVNWIYLREGKPCSRGIGY